MKVQFSSFLSTIAATLSASCCVLPMVLLFIGFTSLGPFAFAMRYSLYIRLFSLIMLGGAFYVLYRPQAKADCENEICSPRSLRRQRVIVWISAGLMVAFNIIASIPMNMTV
jgi:mercuric ion transport protein